MSDTGWGQTLRALLQHAAEQLLEVQGAEDLDEARLEVELLYGRAAELDRVHVIAAGGAAPERELVLEHA